MDRQQNESQEVKKVYVYPYLIFMLGNMYTKNMFLFLVLLSKCL